MFRSAVNAMAPGPTSYQGITDLDRVGRNREVAAVQRYPAAEADYVGARLAVDAYVGRIVGAQADDIDRVVAGT